MHNASRHQTVHPQYNVPKYVLHHVTRLSSGWESSLLLQSLWLDFFTNIISVLLPLGLKNRRLIDALVLIPVVNATDWLFRAEIMKMQIGIRRNSTAVVKIATSIPPKTTISEI